MYCSASASHTEYFRVKTTLHIYGIITSSLVAAAAADPEINFKGWGGGLCCKAASESCLMQSIDGLPGGKASGNC